MQEQQVNLLTSIYGGRPWQPYPGYWLVLVTRNDGALVVFGRDAVILYENAQALEDDDPTCEICLNEPP